jgi:two-component system sensor histidine kinase KdpD
VDDVLLEQVFMNLLENIVKYTPPETPVRISARANAEQVSITIEDSGPGFTHGDEAHVFEKFFRGQVAGVRGVGLGLAICKAIVEKHDGTITAGNVPSGGAVIRFNLPIRDIPLEFKKDTEQTLDN